MTGVTGEVVVISDDELVRDAVASAAAAQELTLVHHGPAELAGRWRAATAVFIGVDRAAQVAELGLSPRERVFVVGRDPEQLIRWSMPLGAEVIPLPEGRAWLASVLALRRGGGRAPILTVLGGSGGVGASTLAAGLAWRAARQGRRVALVDLDPLGGGIDLLLGVEQVDGWRWPRLNSADGFLTDLAPHLPQVDGVAVLSMPRRSGSDVAREPLGAVLASLQRSHELVVCDPGRMPGIATRECLRLSQSVVLLVGTAVRSVAAAQHVVSTLDLRDARVVVRRLPGGTVPHHAIEDALDFPVVGEVAEDARLRTAAEAGDAPPLGGRGGRAWDGLLRELCEVES